MENGNFSRLNLILFQAELLQTGILLYFVVAHIAGFVIVDFLILHLLLPERYHLHKPSHTLLVVCSVEAKMALLALGLALKKFLNPLIKLYFINLLLSISSSHLTQFPIFYQLVVAPRSYHLAPTLFEYLHHPVRFAHVGFALMGLPFYPSFPLPHIKQSPNPPSFS